ncbi:hypothetical protein WA026_014045 [Henosepilachna vigintioctopunctata]|uniref:Glycerate kinase n=1 Tax=Henosepilachna vigintioctopunctata TaxID=420089 RepID=A0AAW1U7L8_9CUCU
MLLSVFKNLHSHIKKIKFGVKMSNTDQILREIFKTSVDSVQPYNLVKNFVSVTEMDDVSHLWVGGQSYEIKSGVHVVGFGKAVLGMTFGIEETLGEHLKMGVVSVPKGILNSNSNMNFLNSKIKYMEGAENNLPDEDSMEASLQIKKLVQKLTGKDIVIVLISGGGSALLPLPRGNISLEEKLELVKQLGNCGADIKEMNCVRKEISELKGGNLAKICYPAKVISLILSDVIGDPLDIIASGPTVSNKDDTEKTIEILEKYSLYDNLPETIKNVLNENLNSEKLHQLVEDDSFIHVDNFVIGNNEMAAKSALDRATELNFQSVILSTKVSGNVDRISIVYANIVQIFSKFLQKQITNEEVLFELQNFESDIIFYDEEHVVQTIESFDQEKDICLILAGEPTVVVTGNGLGGRNQQLALSFSMELHKRQYESVEIFFLSCGTDGIDGPTDAAGAIGYSTLAHDSEKQNLNPDDYLQNNDCYNFFETFEDGRYLVKVGHTGTNVMDIHVILIKKNHKRV